MKNGYSLALLSMIVAVVGLAIALVAYCRKKSCIICDDLDDDFIEYYDDVDTDACCCAGNGDDHHCACSEELE